MFGRKAKRKDILCLASFRCRQLAASHTHASRTPLWQRLDTGLDEHWSPGWRDKADLALALPSLRGLWFLEIPETGMISDFSECDGGAGSPDDTRLAPHSADERRVSKTQSPLWSPPVCESLGPPVDRVLARAAPQPPRSGPGCGAGGGGGGALGGALELHGHWRTLRLSRPPGGSPLVNGAALPPLLAPVSSPLLSMAHRQWAVSLARPRAFL